MTPDPNAFVAYGPWGFILGAAFCIYLATKAWRDGRRSDVEEARNWAVEQKGRADTLQEQLGDERNARLREGTEHMLDQEERIRRERLYRKYLIEEIGLSPVQVNEVTKQ